MTKEIPVFELHLPEYQVYEEPNHEVIGKKVDDLIKQYFLGQHVAIRCLGSCDHLNKDTDELIEIIKQTGSDRYDPVRKGDRYENNEGKHIDFFALEYQVNENSEIFQDFTHPFYHWCKDQDGKPVRLDICIIYDATKLDQISFTYAGRENEGQRSDGWVFRDPDNKPSAILGIIKITG